MAKRDAGAHLPIPDGWGLTQTVLHYEGEDLSADPDPFAGSVVVQLRMDAEPDEDLKKLSENDVASLKGALAGFQSRKATEGGKSLHTSSEFSFTDEDGRALQQLILYGRRGGHVYTVTGTHVQGARFETVRTAASELATALLEG
jgi:hypothetical protein